jgi:hypothetical protein
MTDETHSTDSKVLAEVYIAMNEEGEFEVGTTEEEASQRLVENTSGYSCRLVKINAEMTPPAPIEADVDISDEAGTTIAIENEETADAA